MDIAAFVESPSLDLLEGGTKSELLKIAYGLDLDIEYTMKVSQLKKIIAEHFVNKGKLVSETVGEFKFKGEPEEIKFVEPDVGLPGLKLRLDMQREIEFEKLKIEREKLGIEREKN